MRQPNSQRHREHGYPPKATTPGSRGGGVISGGGGSVTQPDAEVVINGRGNDSSVDSVGSSGHRGRQSPQGLETENRLGQAANPNRAEMPNTGRRKSYDPVSHHA